MITKKVGRQTLVFANPPVIVSAATVVGPEEGAGPLTSDFDLIHDDLLLGQKSFEKAERRMMEEACNLALLKAGLDYSDIDFFWLAIF